MTMRALPVLIAVLALPLGGCAVSIGDSGDVVRVPAPAASSLTVRLQGIETPKGQIMLAMFDSAAAHDRGGEPVRAAAVPVTGASAVTTFEGLAPGDYAIKLFHDLDGDNQMDTNPFGMPIEPFAFSNDAKAEGGPAMWEATRFPVAAGANTISARPPAFRARAPGLDAWPDRRDGRHHAAIVDADTWPGKRSGWHALP